MVKLFWDDIVSRLQKGGLQRKTVSGSRTKKPSKKILSGAVLQKRIAVVERHKNRQKKFAALRLRNLLLLRPRGHNYMSSLFKQSNFKKKITKIIVIRISPNNVIMTLTKPSGKVITYLSAGKLKLACSKRSVKFVFRSVVTEFFKNLKKQKIRFDRGVYYRITAPKKFRRRLVLGLLKKLCKSRFSLFEGLTRLPFNGCRQPKERRKKRKGLRITRNAAL
jgi:ribosomal protein S11